MKEQRKTLYFGQLKIGTTVPHGRGFFMNESGAISIGSWDTGFLCQGFATTEQQSEEVVKAKML